MAATRDDVLRLLEEYAHRPKPTGPVALSEQYLEAVERWETLPENAERTEKGWVLRADRSWRRRSPGRGSLVDEPPWSRSRVSARP